MVTVRAPLHKPVLSDDCPASRLLWGPTFGAALYGNTDVTEEARNQVYADYAASYKKAALSYDRSVSQGRIDNIVYGVVFLLVLLLIVARAQKKQRKYMDDSLEIARANQKALEEIRDLLKK